jgi:hypothetical protein
VASNMGFGVVKELLPDLGRALARKREKPTIDAMQRNPLSTQ